MWTKTVQVCRDETGDYTICPLLSVKPVKDGYGEWEQRDRNGLSRQYWVESPRVTHIPVLESKLFGHLNLAPGAGPVRVTITVERDD